MLHLQGRAAACPAAESRAESHDVQGLTILQDRLTGGQKSVETRPDRGVQCSRSDRAFRMVPSPEQGTFFDSWQGWHCTFHYAFSFASKEHRKALGRNGLCIHQHAAGLLDSASAKCLKEKHI